jgi:hypothetical protein
MNRNELLIGIAKKNGFLISIKQGYNRHYRQAERINIASVSLTGVN